MALSLPYTITNGTVPDADQVQGNDAYLLNNLAGIQAVGKTASGDGTKRTTVGTNTNTLAGTSQSITVASASVLKIDFAARVVFGVDVLGSFIGSVEPLLNGAASGFNAVYTFTADASVAAIRQTVSVSGTGSIGLTAGTHTIALQSVATILNLSGILLPSTGVQITTGVWSGVVVPVP